MPVALAVFFSAVSGAWALGELSQKPGAAGCLSETGADGCQGARSINGANDVVISPDGRNVYVASFSSDAVAIFDRDPATGALTQRPGAGCIAHAGAGNCSPGRALDGPTDLAISPDGRNVYVTASESNSVAIFDRDPATGDLTQDAGMGGCLSPAGDGGCRPGVALLRAGAIAVTADGKSAYVTASFSNSVVILDRDPAGDLTQKPGTAGCISSDGTGEACQVGAGLLNPQDVAIGPDGASVHVADDVGVATFGRDPGTGSLSPGFTASPLRFADALTVSPDGRTLYATVVGSRLAIFDRNPSGALTQKPGPAGCFSANGSGGACQVARGMDGSSDVAISPDGSTAYVAGNRSLLSFDRDAGSGALAQKPGTAGCISSDGTGGACQVGRGMVGIEDGLIVSPDGRNVYLTAGETDAVAIFDRAVPPPADTLAPTVRGFKLAPKRFKVPSKRRPSFRFVLSEPAGVRIVVERAIPGRRVGKRCKAAIPKLAKKQRCRRFVRRATLRFADRSAGANTIRFSGRIGKRALAPGAYRATIFAADPSGNRSLPRRASFVVLPASSQRR
jgi:DNA-binding beta-propeller fold protein YncE